MAIVQKKVSLPAYKRGYHLITPVIEQALSEMSTSDSAGMLNIFIQHTSASLTINENADPSVRHDMEDFFDRSVPENDPNYTHNYEGSDDMPAHIKTSMLDVTLNIPIIGGKLGMGIWQGIYLCEHRDQASSRQIILTLQTN